MISISGVRGIVGESLTPELVMRMGEAFGTYVGGNKTGPEAPLIVVGRDTRVSGEMVKHSVLAGLLSTGCSIVDLGVVTTPTATIMIEALKANGGIVISASHNPIEWNALKFFGSDGIYLDTEEGKQLLDLYYQGDFKHARWHQIQEVTKDSSGDDRHLEEVLKLVDTKLIRSRGFTVALDSCNGAGAGITEKLLEKLGCQLIPIHCTPDGLFPHDPEPSFLNLQDLCELAAREDVDVAFAQDPDADRLAIVDENGSFLGEEYTLALAADFVLSGLENKTEETATRVVVINMSTSRVTEEVALRHGCRCLRVPVGEVNVAVRMREEKAIIGGEGNGGVIDPRVHYGRDSLVGIVLILESMARSGKKISELAADLPSYQICKAKIALSRTRTAETLNLLSQTADGQGAKVNTEDGLRLDWEDCWVHVRPSNTEPVVRIIAEATTSERAQELIQEFSDKIHQLEKDFEEQI
jgi:phosphoglucosamine mutase